MMSEWSQDGGSYQLTLTDLSSPLCALSLSTCANEQAKFPLKRRAAFLFANNFFFLFNSLNSSSNSHYNIHNSQLCLIGEGERHTETSSKKTCRQLLCSVIDSRIYFLSLSVFFFSSPSQSPPKGATIPYRPKPQVNGPVILANGQAYTIQGNFAVPSQEVNI